MRLAWARRRRARSMPDGRRIRELCAGGACSDKAALRDCEYWSTYGDCEDNAGFMRENCARSCGVCTENKDEL